MNPMNMQSSIIRKLIVADAGTSNDQAVRNFNTHLTPDDINNMRQNTMGGTNVTAAAMAGISGTILSPDVNSTRPANILHGWGARRYRIFLHVTSATAVGGNFQYFYSGYTDVPGMLQNGQAFDPNMRIYLNSVLQITTTAIPNAFGVLEPNYTISNVSHILHPNNLGGNYQTQYDPANPGGSVVPSMLRPTDVLFDTFARHQSAQNPNMPIMPGNTAVMSTMMSRLQYQPAMWLSKSFDALNSARGEMDMTGGGHNPATNQMYGSAMMACREGNFQQDGFINSLKNSNFAMSGFITFGDLQAMHPEIMNGVIKFANDGSIIKVNDNQAPTPGGNLYRAERGEYAPIFNNASGTSDMTMCASIAHTLLQAVPGVLLSNLMSTARIMATNTDPNKPGMISVHIDSPLPVIEIDGTALAKMIPIAEGFIANSIMKDLPMSNLAPFSTTMVCSVFGQSFIKVAFNGVVEEYNQPSFSDSMFSPLLAQNQIPLQQIGNDLSHLYDGVTGL